MCAEKINLFRTVRPSAVTIAEVLRAVGTISIESKANYLSGSLALELTDVLILPRDYLESVPRLK